MNKTSKLVIAALAVSLMGSALAQDAPTPPSQPAPSADNSSTQNPSASPKVPGVKDATLQSVGDMVPFYVVGGVVLVGGIVAAANGGSSHSGQSTSGSTSGTTGTH